MLKFHTRATYGAYVCWRRHDYGRESSFLRVRRSCNLIRCLGLTLRRTIPQDRSLVNDQAAKDVILSVTHTQNTRLQEISLIHRHARDLELRAINLQYRSEVYASLPPFGYAVQLFEDRQRLQSIFDAVKPVFAEYNKWDEYGIALPFKDTDLMPHERLVFSNGISTPWRKTSQHAIERLIVPRCLRAWRGGAAAYSYQLQSHGPETLRDLDFEHRAVAYLGELALERLSYPIQGISDTVIYEVEGTQGRARVLYPQEISECLTRSGNAVPILWQFRRFREGASDRYRITPTRFRLRESEDQTRLPAELSCDDRRTEHSSSSPYKRSALKVSPRTSTAQRHADSRNEETLRMVDSGVAQPERSSAVLSRYGDLPKRRFLRRGLSKMSIGIGDSRKWSERL